MAVPLHGFQTWFSAIRKGHRLIVFDNRMLRNRLKMGQTERDREKVNEERKLISRKGAVYNTTKYIQ